MYTAVPHGETSMYIGMKLRSTNTMFAILASNVEVFLLFSVKECHDYGKLWQSKEYIFPITKELFPLKGIPDYVDLYTWLCCLIHYNKGKAVPLQAWSVPEGSRKLRFPDFMTTAQYTGLFISPSGISEIDLATTKTDMAERSISIGRESLQVFFLY